jgi:predicted permease
MRQFLAESALLAAAGGVAGLALAGWGSRLLMALVSDPSSPLHVDISLNGRILAFTFLTSLGAVVLFGVAPASVATRQSVMRSLKLEVARARLSLPRGLVVLQVGLSLLLLTVAGLFLQTLVNLRTVDLGFASSEIVQVGISPRQAGYSGESAKGLYRRLQDRLSAAPGITATALASSAFRTGMSRTCCVAIQGRAPVAGEDREVQTMDVTLDYFRTMSVPIMRGRTFASSDLIAGENVASARVAIVNQAMARQFFGTDAPIGRRLGWGDPPAARYDVEVIGVAHDVIYGDLRTGAPPIIYFPTDAARYLIVRAALPVSSIAGLVRREIQAVEPALDVDVRTVPQLREQAVVREGMLAKLAGFFGTAALLLAGLGLYGLMAYAVTCRTKEIAIKMALGAGRHLVARQIFAETLRLVLLGIGLGAAASWGTTRLVASALFGVRPADPVTLGVATLMTVAVTALAVGLPARRATRVEPIVALRQD